MPNSPNPPFAAARAAGFGKMDLCIHIVQAYPHLPMSTQASGAWVSPTGRDSWQSVIGVE